MGCTRIMNENFLDPDILAESFVSSEQAAFPVDNIYNKQRRSKVWRSAGLWEIESGSNTISFNESTFPSTLVATVPPGEYTTTSLFLAIKTAMEAVGGNSYTVAYETGTNRIKITSDLAIPASVFDFYSASDPNLPEILGFDIVNDSFGAAFYIAGEVRIHTSEWIKWDMGISTNPEAFILIGPRNTPIKIAPSATIKLQGNETDTWASPSYETTLTYNDYVIFLMSDEGLHTEPLRYWRLLIIDIDNPNGYVEIGSLFLGNYYETVRGAVQFPFTGTYIDNTVTTFSEGGQTFSDARDQSESFSINWAVLTKEEKEVLDLFFSDFGTGIPFFISMDKNAAFSSSENYYIRYCKLISPPSYSLASPNNFSMTMELREEL